MKMKRTLSLAAAAVIAIPSFSAFAMEQSAFDSGMKRGIEYFSKGLYYEARDEFQWFADYNWGKLNDGQQKYLLDYLDGAKQKTQELKAAAGRITNEQFDEGMRKGIEYFNKGMYYEACDEFQWFCDNNWWRMNDGQRSYALEYLDGTKAKFSEYVQVYFLGYGYIETDWIHKSRIDEYMKKGWSTTKPKAQYDTTDTILKDKAVAYLKSSLYWPNSATIHQTRVVNKEDEWDRENGIVPCDVYIDYTAMTLGGFYSRGTSIVSMEFNRYNGEYIFCDIEW